MAPYSSEDRLKIQDKNMEQKQDVPVPSDITNNGTRENGWSDNPCKYHIFSTFACAFLYKRTVKGYICNLRFVLQFRLYTHF